VARKLRAYKKNKKTSYIAIVGFGRPKFKGAAKAESAQSETVSQAKTCPTCGQNIK
jgi:hypothetical protein